MSRLGDVTKMCELSWRAGLQLLLSQVGTKVYLRRDTKLVSLALRKQSIQLAHQMRQSHKLFNKN